MSLIKPSRLNASFDRYVLWTTFHHSIEGEIMICRATLNDFSRLLPTLSVFGPLKKCDFMRTLWVLVKLPALCAHAMQFLLHCLSETGGIRLSIIDSSNYCQVKKKKSSEQVWASSSVRLIDDLIPIAVLTSHFLGTSGTPFLLDTWDTLLWNANKYGNFTHCITVGMSKHDSQYLPHTCI